MVKDIVVNLASRRAQDLAADYAISIATTLGAHLTGLAFMYETVIADGAFGGVPVELIEMQRDESKKLADAAVAHFDAQARSAGIASDSRIIDASAGGAATSFGRIARHFDLAVVGQAQPEQPMGDDLMIEGALFESGRPLIVVPYIQKGGLKLDRVLVCWDGGRTAARAIGDAMPLLERAKAVEIVAVAEPRKQDEVTGANMSQHLTRHGVRATPKRLTTGDVGIEEAILSYAADSSADFIVMGGYGHSRLREFILGGVTRGILQSMTVPVLMSH
ncbi:MAG: universal stress protein [Xanthobacteraceae bacterium]